MFIYVLVMALRTAKSMLRRNPIVWNSGLYLTLYGTGEFTQQVFRPQNGINLRSIAHIGILGGFVFAPMYFSWYKFLDRLIVGTGLRFSLLKVACDQAICAPIAVAVFYVGKLLFHHAVTSLLYVLFSSVFVCADKLNSFLDVPFLIGLSALEGREDLLAELKLKFKKTYMVRH